MIDAYNLATKYDDVLFILNHTGEPCYQTQNYIKNWEENMRKIASCENFVTKISGLGMFDPKWTTESTKIFVEKTIDLHGYTLEEANKKIFEYIENCYLNIRNRKMHVCIKFSS